MNNETHKAINNAVSALISLRLNDKKEKVIPLPTKQGLERRYKITLDDKGNACTDGVK